MNYLSAWFFAISFVFVLQANASELKSKEDFCKQVNKRFKQFKWKRIICNPERWDVYGHSSQGNPLLYQKFGFEVDDSSIPVNLVLCSIHGGEANGSYACFHIVRDMIYGRLRDLKKMKIVVAPIVNPDGFLNGTRTNSRGVDINRNLPTADCSVRAPLTQNS